MKFRAAAIAAVGFLGMVDALYLTVMRGVRVPCSATGGCNEVLTSEYSTIMGVPLSVIGLVFYVTVFCLAVLDVFEVAPLLKWIFRLALPAFVVTLVLLYLQAFVILHFCQYCLASAAFVTTIFLIAAWPRRATQNLN